MKKIILSIIALLSVTVMEAQKNQTHLTLNNGVAIPQFGLGVYSIPAGEVTYNSVLTALKAALSAHRHGSCLSERTQRRPLRTAAFPVILSG